MGEFETKILCSGCLRSGRKLFLIEDFLYKQCFMYIMSEVMLSWTANKILLCWECKAVIQKFVRFKKQVQNSHKLLHDANREFQDLANIEIEAQHNPKYNITNIFNISLPPNNNDNCIDIIKDEFIDNIEGIKEENQEDISLHSDYISDDDKALIDLCVKKKVKKKKKKEILAYTHVVLTREEVEEERLKLANADEYVNAMYKCEMCILSFPNSDDLKEHTCEKHNANKANFKCEICERTFNTDITYNYHANRHTHRFECAICNERFPTKRGVARHREQWHCQNDWDIKTEEITKESNSKDGDDTESVLDDSSLTNGKQELYPCPTCNKVFKWKTSLRKHSETHRIDSGQKRKPHCEVCGLSFRTTSNLQKHVKASSKHQIQLKVRKLAESLPDDGSTDKRLATVLVDEIKLSVNNSRPQHACNICGKRFQWRGNLLRHVHSHKARANGELVCVPCKRTFSSIATYKQHMKISKKHVTENDYEHMCNDCGKRFANKTKLQDHIDWDHLKNFVHVCNICQKVFKTHTSLYLHKQVVHQKDSAEHLCDHCGKPFPNQTKLRIHVNALHSSRSSLVCGLCPARFSWHSCLSRHRRRVHKQGLNAV